MRVCVRVCFERAAEQQEAHALYAVMTKPFHYIRNWCFTKKSAERPVISMVCRLMKGYIRDD